MTGLCNISAGEGAVILLIVALLCYLFGLASGKEQKQEKKR